MLGSDSPTRITGLDSCVCRSGRVFQLPPSRGSVASSRPPRLGRIVVNSSMRSILIALNLLFATIAQAEVCRGILHNTGIQAGARIGSCKIVKSDTTGAVFDACHYGQQCEVDARLRAGNVIEVLSVPTTNQVCRGRVSVGPHGVANIQAISNFRADPLACWFYVDSNIGRRILHTCYARSTPSKHCWIHGKFTRDRGGSRQLVQVNKVLDF